MGVKLLNALYDSSKDVSDFALIVSSDALTNHFKEE